MSEAPPACRVWAGLGLVYVVWGSTSLAIAYVVETPPPLRSASLRCTVAGGLMEAVGLPTVVGGAITVFAVAVVVSSVQRSPGASSPRSSEPGPTERHGRVRRARM